MATPTNSASTVTVSPLLSFVPIPRATTCQSLEITWSYNGPDSTAIFFVTNIGVPQGPPPSSTSSTRRNTFTDSDDHHDRRAVPTGATPQSLVSIFEEIGADIFLFSQQQSFTWESVDVPQGWYTINASVPDQSYSDTSNSFFVLAGSDTSCVLSTTSPTSSSSSVPVSSTLLPTSSSTSTSSPSVVGFTSASKNIGTIVGVCIGGFALIAIVLTAWFFLYRKAKATMVNGTQGSRGPVAKWNGLSSVDSRTMGAVSKKGFPSPHYQTHSSSKGTIPVNASQELLGAEKNSIYGDPFNGPAVALSTIPVLHQPGSRSKTGSRTYSASSSTSNGFGGSNEYAAPPVRRPSVPDSVVGRQSIDSQNTYPPSPVSPHGGLRNSTFTTASMSRSQSVSTSHTHQISALSNLNPNITPSQTPPAQGVLHQSHSSISSSAYPQSNINHPTLNDPAAAAAKQTNRQSLGGKKRKPVPTYDPNEDVPSSPFAATSSSPASPSPLSSSPTPDQGSVYGGHYATRGQAGQDQSQHDLVHKSSFGPGGIEGKPLHYLIPDMPMPMKD